MPWKDCSVMDERLLFVARRLAAWQSLRLWRSQLRRRWLPSPTREAMNLRRDSPPAGITE
jgi:hypothetical protein